MEVQEILTSGLLEVYALGIGTLEENAVVEAALQKYPELNAEMAQNQATLEGYAHLHAMEPPASLKNKIANQLLFNAPAVAVRSIDSAPNKYANSQNGNLLNSEGKIRSFRPHLIAASVLLVISMGANMMMMRKLEKVETAQLEVKPKAEVNTGSNFEKVNNGPDASAVRSNLEMSIINCPTTRKVNLLNLPGNPDAEAVVYYKPSLKIALLAVKNLPAAPEGKQYQLWAIVKGGPVNMGVFDIDGSMHDMPLDVQSRPESFAITLENKGGSPQPTLEKMFASGTVI